MAEGSDDDLGMDTDYSYDSDNLLEGIISKKIIIHFHKKLILKLQ